MAGNLIQEYLVGLGIKDNFTGKLKQVLTQSSQQVKTFTKGLAMAGGAVAGILFAANAGIAKLTTGLVKSDDEITKYAKDIGKSKEEAAKMKYALDAMGKSLDEIKADEGLHKKFVQLQKDAKAMQPPDLSAGLKQVRDIQMEFTRMKHSVTYAMQWVGHYLFKYLQQPIQKIKSIFGGLNDSFIKNMPKWTEKIASVMASVVSLGATVIRGALNIFIAIKKIFDMIPGNIKIVMGILTALALFIKTGPLGQLMIIFSLLILLAEDFFTYLDGGDALLGGLWQWLIDIWNELNKQGGAIEKLKESFQKAMEAVSQAINNVIGWVKDFWDQLNENDIIDNFRIAFEKIGEAIGKIFEAAQSIVSDFLSLFGSMADDAQPFLVWLLSEGVPGAIGLIADVIGTVAEALQWFFSLEGVKEIVLGIALAFGVWTAAQWLLNAAMAVNPIVWIIAAIVALIAIVYLLVKNWEKVADFFKGLWEKIKSPFLGIREWFAGKFRAAKEAVIGAFSSIVGWFTQKVMAINNVFMGIPTFFRSKFQQAKNNIVSVFSSIGKWFSDKVSDIKEKFISVPGFVRDKFEDAVEKIKEVFQPLVDWFSEKIGAIKDFFGGIGDKVSGFFNGGKKDTPTTGHADGVISTQEHVARVSEGNQPEAIIPLNKPARAKKVLSGAMDYLGGVTGKTSSNDNTLILGISKICSVLSGIQNIIASGFKNVSNILTIAFSQPRGVEAQDSPHSSAITARLDSLHAILSNGFNTVLAALKEGLSRNISNTGHEPVYHEGLMNLFSSISGDLTSLTQYAAHIRDNLTRMNAMLNQYTNYLYTTYVTNNRNCNNTYDMKSSYTINDVSGRPEAIVNAVDRTKQTQLRNLQGVLNS